MAALVQAWVASSGTGSTGIALTNLVSAPTNGNMVIVCALTDAFSSTLSAPTDNFGDSGGGSWTNAIGAGLAGLDSNLAIYYRTIGSGATGKTITVHQSGTVTMVGYTAEFSGIGAIDGTPTSATGSGANDPGAITTTEANGLVIGFASKGVSLPTAGTGFTRQATSTASNNSAVEDNTPYTTAAGSVDPNWGASAVNWVSLGAAFKSNAATGAGRLVNGNLVGGSLVGSLA